MAAQADGDGGDSDVGWGGRMRFEPAPSEIARDFLVDAAKAARYCRQLQVLVEVVEKKQMRIVAFQPVPEHRSSVDPGACPTVYQLMVTGRVDFILERLGRNHGMPRGFPVLWWPGRRIQIFGFRPKFANDDRQESWDGGSGFQGFGAFKKWSGFLGQLIAFEHEGRSWWAACSKNSATHVFADDAARLFDKVLSKNLVEVMIKNLVHVCAEVMSHNDQHHGAKVLEEMPVVTAIGVGTVVDLSTGSVLTDNPANFVTFKSFAQTIEFCREHKLPVGSAVIATGKGADALITQLSALRDEMTDTKFDSVVAKAAEEFPEHVNAIEGTVTHKQILGDTLEGLVIHAYKTDDDCDVPHNEVVRAIDSGNTAVIKFKFPAYTVRTMCIRRAVGHPDVIGFDGKLHRGKDPIPLACFEDFCLEWASRWCVTAAGRSKWRLFAWEAMLLASDAESRARFDDPKVDLHIQLAEHITIHGIRQNLQDEIKEHSDSLLLLTSKVTVVLLFAPNDRVSAFQKMLLEKGVASSKGGKAPQDNRSPGSGWVNIVTMPLRPSINTGSIYEYPPQVPPSSLLDWQRDKVAKQDSAADRGIVAVADDTEFLTALRASDNVIQRGDDEGAEVTPVELQLRDGSAAVVHELLQVVRMRGKEAPPLVILLVGPQAVGKSSICEALAGEGMRVCSADIHMNAGGQGFDKSRLEACHQACQRDVIDAINAGGGAVVDNTNMVAAHRTVYQRIARDLGADILVKAVAPDVWLAPNATTKAVDALCVRDLRRSLRKGTVPLRRVTIEKTVEVARKDCGKLSIDSWLLSFPSPSYESGIVDVNGALAWRSIAVQNAADAALASPRVQNHPGMPAALLQRAIARGFDEFHISLLSPGEFRQHVKLIDKKSVDATATTTQDQLEFGAVGRVEKGDQWALFVVCNWPWAQEWRASLGLPPKDLHITLAFSDEDIHNIPKGLPTCDW